MLNQLATRLQEYEQNRSSSRERTREGWRERVRAREGGREGAKEVGTWQRAHGSAQLLAREETRRDRG
jgi:hypothetical protein